MINDMVCICPKHGRTAIDRILPSKAVKLVCGCVFIQRETGKFSPPRIQKSAAEKLRLLELFRASRKSNIWARDITGVSWQTLHRWRRDFEENPALLEPQKIGRPRKAQAETKTTNKGS